MANIKLTLPGAPFTGQIVTFTAPCGCDQVTDGLSINGEIYTVVDLMGKCVTGKGGAWCSGAQVTVTLDVEGKLAYMGGGSDDKCERHWWKRRSLVTGNVEEVTTISSVMLNPSTGDADYFADSYTVDVESGLYSLDNPTQLKQTSGIANVRGKYAIIDGTSGSTIYYIPENASYEAASTLAWYYRGDIEQRQIISVTDSGVWRYVSSDDRNAYPDSGVSGNWEYEYLGVPFENAREPVRVQSGSYTGTGTTTNSSSPLTLELNFVPKLVYIVGEKSLSIFPAFKYTSEPSNAVFYCDSSSAMNSGYSSYGYVNGTTFYWYNSSSNKARGMNTNGEVYNWMAIG